MRLYLSLGQVPPSGFTCVDVLKQNVNLTNMNDICEAAECTEIVVDHVLQLVPHNQLVPVLQHLASRLRRGGKITVLFPNLNTILRLYQNGDLSEAQANNLVFGEQVGNRSLFSHRTVELILSKLELGVESVQLSGISSVVIAKRP
jgi:hypothetical protein